LSVCCIIHKSLAILSPGAVITLWLLSMRARARTQRLYNERRSADNRAASAELKAQRAPAIFTRAPDSNAVALIPIAEYGRQPYSNT
jgi:hypothetical protein